MQVKKPLITRGWLRALLFLITWIIFSTAAGVGMQWLLSGWNNGAPVPMGADVPTLLQVTVSALVTLAVVWAWRHLVDRRSLYSLGFQWKPFAAEAWLGFFTGPALLGIGMLGMLAFSFLQLIGVQINFAQLLLSLVLMLIISFSEELVVRGYLLHNLLQSCNRWVALVITSVFFSLMHLTNPAVTVVSLANIVIAGLLLGINYIYTRNLWFGIFLHFSWNFFQGPIFGFEVSGISLTGVFQQQVYGPTLFTGEPFGFEGSVFCTVLLVITTTLYAWMFSRRYQAAI